MRRALAGDDHGTLRLVGGVLFGIGALVLLVRRTQFNDPWGDGAVLLVLLIPAVKLYGMGLAGARANVRPTAWQSTFTIFGLLLIPLALFAFLSWVGGDTSSSWNTAWIFALSGLFGLVAALAGRVRYAGLVAGLLFAVAWLALWDEILSGGLAVHIGTLRWLLVFIGLILLAVAVAVWMRQADGPSPDIVTAAGVALVLAGGLTAVSSINGGPLVVLSELRSSVFWDIELLVVSLAFLVHGVVAAVRGTTYVGAIGLLIFVMQVGFDLDDRSPSGHAVGWPLVLLVLGVIALAISIAPAVRRGSS